LIGNTFFPSAIDELKISAVDIRIVIVEYASRILQVILPRAERNNQRKHKCDVDQSKNHLLKFYN
jgi:hypothetical protein